MADDKKSFVAYADWQGQFNLLSNEEAGILIKHILSYVNDEYPELPNDNRILNIAFEPIKSQLKRDLKKYETKKKDKSENGAIGNLKRWHVDLYELFIKNEISLEQAKNIASSRTKSHSDNSDRTRIATVANIADTVTVTDTVNDTVTVTVSDTVIGDPHTKNFSTSFGKQSIEILKKNCAGHKSWLDSIGMKNSLLPDQVLEWFDAFCLHLLSSGKTEETESEFKRYCSSWISSEIRQGRTIKIEQPPEKSKPAKVNLQQAFQQSIIKEHGQ
ncbi:DUF6291 domain-containing protein [Sphingobacterium sp. ML3W]|uniref:DUF6291 domain-containing protein n=1 Tax=Sphingobacterium sp. ML3W TaxID=1538644 RepID=UPI00249ACCDE|nr:DUF6291 domain-containing protein [Sphingobacterium sp. ML3W]WFA79699.1 DUF6291 domain-containing protein [Sphingobacterium sp. ML3W]